MTTMEPKTLTALRGSIDKWRAIVAGDSGDLGVRNCPLCAVFYDVRCVGCPVSERSGAAGCVNTPYIAWAEEWDDNRVTDDRSRTLAQAELDFLVSLLPGETL